MTDRQEIVKELDILETKGYYGKIEVVLALDSGIQCEKLFLRQRIYLYII